MRHLKRGRKLNRSSAHRTALLRNLACELFAREQITTTLAKAKELRPYAERLITLAKRGHSSVVAAANGSPEDQQKANATLINYRRMIMSRLGGKKSVAVPEGDVDVARKLVSELAPRFADRPGGYTRIVKLSKRRLGDAGFQAMIILLKEGEEKPVREKREAAPRRRKKAADAAAPAAEPTVADAPVAGAEGTAAGEQTNTDSSATS